MVLERFNTENKTSKWYYFDQAFPNHLPFKIIRSKYMGPAGEVWLGTENGLYRYNSRTDKFLPCLTSRNVLSQEIVRQIYQSPSHSELLWLATKRIKDQKLALVQLNLQTGITKHFTHNINDGDSLGSDTVRSIFEDKQHRLWIGTTNGLSFFNSQSNQFENYCPQDTTINKWGRFISNIKEGNDGYLWLTCGYGLLRFDPKSGRSSA